MNRKNLFRTLLVCAALSVPAMSFAEPIANPEAQPAAEAVATPADAQSEATKSQTEVILKNILQRLPKISGYLQTGYNYNSVGDGTSSFQAKRLRLLVDGNVAPRFSVRLQLELFNGVGGSTNGNGQKTIQVMDAFVTAKVSDALKFRAGQYYLPLGYENYDISPATLETIDFSNICYRIVCRNPIGYNFVDYGRDLGIMAFGDLLPNKDGGFHYLGYNLSLTNGSLPMRDDNNKSKDFVGSLTIRPIKHLNFKASYNWGEYNGKVDGVDYKYQAMNRFVVGGWYNNPKGLDLRAEYAFASSKHDGNKILDEKGFYALAAWHAGKFLPVVRYDMYRDDTHSTTLNNYDRYLVGLSYTLCKNVKFQANYAYSVYTKEAREASNHGEKGSSQLQIMGLFSF